MTEQWRQIDDFPDYAVSDHGRVKNIKTDRIKVASLNQQGIPNVNFVVDGEQNRRSVALLVATAFVPRTHQHIATPINMDGDRTNNHVSNLQWRARWFAVMYHKQFRPGYRPAIPRPIMDVKTGVIYPTSMHAAREFGLLDNEILLAIVNRTVVFPTHQSFQLVDPT